jgi:RHS repeat-associated protein
VDKALSAVGAQTAATSPSTSVNAVSVTVSLRAGRVTPVVRYGFSGGGDTADLTLDAAGAVVEQTVGLPGGSSVTRRPGSTDVWSHPNLRGDVAATSGPSGAKIGATFTYDPYGSPLGTLPDNSAGSLDYGWLGQHQRPLEHQAGLLPIIEMGARQYDPTLGRFLEVDPVEGGSCNDYDYVCADPVGGRDLDGLTGQPQECNGQTCVDGRRYSYNSCTATRYGGKKCTRLSYVYRAPNGSGHGFDFGYGALSRSIQNLWSYSQAMSRSKGNVGTTAASRSINRGAYDLVAKQIPKAVRSCLWGAASGTALSAPGGVGALPSGAAGGCASNLGQLYGPG